MTKRPVKIPGRSNIKWPTLSEAMFYVVEHRFKKRPLQIYDDSRKDVSFDDSRKDGGITPVQNKSVKCAIFDLITSSWQFPVSAKLQGSIRVNTAFCACL